MRQNNQFFNILFRIYGNDDWINFDTQHMMEANGNPKKSYKFKKRSIHWNRIDEICICMISSWLMFHYNLLLIIVIIWSLSYEFTFSISNTILLTLISFSRIQMSFNDTKSYWVRYEWYSDKCIDISFYAFINWK